jgi:hypothetical protein
MHRHRRHAVELGARAAGAAGADRAGVQLGHGRLLIGRGTRRARRLIQCRGRPLPRPATHRVRWGWVAGRGNGRPRDLSKTLIRCAARAPG